MTPSHFKVIGAAAAVAGALFVWYSWRPTDERAIKRQLEALTGTVNEEAPEGLGAVARAAQIGSYFTSDVVIDLGQGSTPIQGRETLIGMAARLQPRLAGYTLEFDDVNVAVQGEAGTADVTLAAIFRSRSGTGADRAIDARELLLGMTKIDGVWRIARVNAVDILRRE